MRLDVTRECHVDAARTGFAGLRLLGVDLPERGSTAAILRELAAIRSCVRGKTAAALQASARVLSCARMSPRVGLLAALLVTPLAGCGDEVVALAERPPEPTIWAVRGDGEAAAMAGDIEFAGGAVLGARVFMPVTARPGAALHVQFSAGGVGAQALWVGLRAPRAAGHQEVVGQSRRTVEAVVDARDRWVEASVTDGQASATIEVPAQWHAMHAVVLVELRDGTRRTDPQRGPRLDRGAGVLGVVPVATRPTAIAAPRATDVTIDGLVEEATWARPATLLHQSLDGEPDLSATAIDVQALGDDALMAGRGTTVRVGWDPEFLYVAASLPDVDLWTEYGAQDDPLYAQEAFELFVAAGNDGTRYLEYEVSARGVTFDARFPRYRAGDEAWDSAWRTAVVTRGTVNDARDRDLGWSAELAIPWTELCGETALVCPPAPGMRLRINAFRLERPDRKRTDALALSPTRAPDFHAWANAAELELQ